MYLSQVFYCTLYEAATDILFFLNSSRFTSQDNNGTIDFAEFTSIYSTTMRSVGNLMCTYLAQKHEEGDTAHGEAMANWSSPMVTPKAIRAAFDELDIDKDGKITLEEFKAGAMRSGGALENVNQFLDLLTRMTGKDAATAGGVTLGEAKDVQDVAGGCATQ